MVDIPSAALLMSRRSIDGGGLFGGAPSASNAASGFCRPRRGEDALPLEGEEEEDEDDGGGDAGGGGGFESEGLDSDDDDCDDGECFDEEAELWTSPGKGSSRADARSGVADDDDDDNETGDG